MADAKKPSGGGMKLNKESMFFATIVALGLGLFFVTFQILDPISAVILLTLIAIVMAFIPSLTTFKEYERGVVFRLGKFHRIVGPGLYPIIPFIENFTPIDTRTQTLDIPSFDVVTKENIRVGIDGTLFYSIVDPKKAVVEVKDYAKSLGTLFQTQIRAVIARTPLETLLEDPAGLAPLLITDIDSTSLKWGVHVTRVELRKIKLPAELEESAVAHRAAEEKRERTRIRAEARKIMIDTVQSAVEDMDDRTFSFFYLDALKKIADGRSTKLILPIELTKFSDKAMENGWTRSISDSVIGRFRGKV